MTKRALRTLPPELDVKSSLGVPTSLLRSKEEERTEEVSIPPKAIEYPNRLYVPSCGVVPRHVRQKQWNQRSYVKGIKGESRPAFGELFAIYDKEDRPKESKAQQNQAQ